MTILAARNIHRAHIIEAAAGNMAGDITSHTIDFREMVTGSIQVKWSGNDEADGSVVVEASNICEDSWFDEIDCTEVTLADDGSKGQRKTRLFNLGVIGFRFARVKYFAGSNTTGQIEAIALAKIGG